MKTSIRNQRAAKVEFVCDDPNLTPAAGLLTVAELDRVLGMVQTVDEAVGSLARPAARGKPYTAGEVVLSFAESQLAGGDFILRRSSGSPVSATGAPYRGGDRETSPGGCDGNGGDH